MKIHSRTPIAIPSASQINRQLQKLKWLEIARKIMDTASYIFFGSALIVGYHGAAFSKLHVAAAVLIGLSLLTYMASCIMFAFENVQSRALKRKIALMDRT